ncbi:MAG: HD-GYP domain-containing protein [Gemmatimonadota bacterium]
MPFPGAPATPVRFFSSSEVISSLTCALDLTEGQPAGHTMRSCAIGMRLGGELGLSDQSLSALFYALLLKDAGCSTNATQLAAAFSANDHDIKREHKRADLTRPLEGARYVWQSVAPGASWLLRVRLFLEIALGKRFDTREIIRLRCERGADIAARLGFSAETADAVRALDEHWDGSGHPAGLRQQQIPLLGRIACIAQCVEVFAGSQGAHAACDVALLRSGKWFDPQLVSMTDGWRKDAAWWRSLYSPELPAMIQQLEPQDRLRTLNEDGLDQIAEAFAQIIDAKSPYTFEHSTGVARLGRGIAARLGMDAQEQRRVYRAGLLHDVGKLGVSNRILDKPGKLDAAEWESMKQHPKYTLEVLRRVRAFEEFAITAALHHERLDGNGYPWRMRGDQLDDAARLLAVADMYEALTADRPYRVGLTRTEALRILQPQIGRALDGGAVEALIKHLDDTAQPSRISYPAVTKR